MTVIDDTELIERCERFLREHDPITTPRFEFLTAQFEAGLAYVHYEPGDGGLGLTPRMHRLAAERLRAGGVPGAQPATAVGHGMAGPTLATHGTVEQRQAWLRPLFTGEEIWCQLFSEPGAGSDLASLATRAVSDGDTWIINGQKIWTTLGHLADWGLLLTRTDPEAVKHRGLTYFVLDMHSPGVTVRPIRQMTGESEFCEVSLEDVRVPDEHRIGAVGAGWSVAITTLMNERVSIGGATPQRGDGLIGHALSLWRTHPDQSHELRDRLVALWIEAESLRLTNIRASQLARRGRPGPEGSVGKLVSAELTQRILDLCVDLEGAPGMAFASYDAPASPALDDADGVAHAFLRSRGVTIAGGTSEVMRGIIGERVLGLPREPRTDTDRPWSQVPRS